MSSSFLTVLANNVLDGCSFLVDFEGLQCVQTPNRRDCTKDDDQQSKDDQTDPGHDGINQFA